MNGDGFLKLTRSEESFRLMCEDPIGFVLLSIVAWRVRRTGGYSRLELGPGQCVLGDYEAIGMTRAQYREAIKRLTKAGFISKIATPCGTIVTLLDKRIYDVNLEDNSQQTANAQPTNDQQTTTNKNIKKVKNERESVAEFEKVWEIYPNRKHQSKAKAFEVFKSIDVAPGVIVDAIEKQRKSDQWKRENGRFIPHLHTYLKDRIWETADEKNAIQSASRMVCKVCKKPTTSLIEGKCNGCYYGAVNGQ